MAYLHSHQGFDLDEPVEVQRVRPPEPSLPIDVGPNTPKIFNGTPGYAALSAAAFFPVVYLYTPVDRATVDGVNAYRNMTQTKDLKHGSAATCTGTFIAKHWITTAAHCLLTRAAWDATVVPGVAPMGQAKVLGYYGYGISWPDSAGNPVYHLGTTDSGPEKAWIYQIPDPDYVGFDPLSNYSEPPSHDFAMLHVPNLYDGTLPPDAETSSWAVSLVDRDPNWSLTAWGYGRTNLPVDDNTGVGVLRSTPIQTNVGVNGGDVFTQPAPPASTQYGTTCEGDSGGPWVRQVLSADTGLPQTVIVGTLVGPVFASAFSVSNCGVTPGDVTRVVAISHEITFINDEINLWSPGFTVRCTPRLSQEAQLNGSTTPDYAECFKSSCKKDKDCPDTRFSCENPSGDPGQSFDRCPVCDFLNGAPQGPLLQDGTNNCGCISGQCILKPDADAGQ